MAQSRTSNPKPDDALLTDEQRELLKSGDHVWDPVFGVVYKDVETKLRAKSTPARAEVHVLAEDKKK